MLIVFLTVFIDLLGFGIVLPVMPRQVEPFLRALGVSEIAGGIVIGLLFSSFSLMQFLFSPLWGRLSDRFGRRPLLLVSLLGSVVFYALYGYAVSCPTDPLPTPRVAAWALGLMFASRIGAGIAGASVGTAAAVIADCTTPENRARGSRPATPQSTRTAATNGSVCEGCAANSTEPRNGPRMRPRDAKAWFTPRTSPCRCGSERREMSADTDGFTQANPATATAAAA